MRKSDPNVNIEHLNINSPLLLENAIKNSNTVVYFTHDYYSMVQNKNEQLKNCAEICKAYEVEKLIAVNPLEFINYFTNDGFSNDPMKDEKEAQDEAM